MSSLSFLPARTLFTSGVLLQIERRNTEKSGAMSVQVRSKSSCGHLTTLSDRSEERLYKQF